MRQSAWAQWAGAIAGSLGWALHQQVLSNMLHYDCSLGGAVQTVVATVLVLGFIAAGAWTSWLARPPVSEQEQQAVTRRFVADLSLLAAALFSLPVLAGLLAGLIVPGCPQ